MQPLATTSWLDIVKTYLHPRVITMLFFGFSAGIPILLIFSTLSLWLREAGVDRSAVTFFSWAALGYSFKFVWAPIIDKMPLPFFTKKLGQRRSWMLLSQITIIIAIIAMGFIDPASQTNPNALVFMAIAAILLGFSSATQDIVIDAYRIESAAVSLQALMSSTYIAGYRIGMITAGAGGLFLAAEFGSSMASYSYAAWRLTYVLIALTMLVGLVTTLIISEPARDNHKSLYMSSLSDYLRFVLLFIVMVSAFIMVFFFSSDAATAIKHEMSTNWEMNKKMAAFLIESARLFSALAFAWLVARLCVSLHLVNTNMLRETYIAPVNDFFQRYGWNTAILLLLLVGFYRVSDIVLGVISNVFYQDIGFNKKEIAGLTKTFGLIMTIVGGFLGGALTLRYGVMRILLLGAILSSVTNLLFIVLAHVGNDIGMLTIIIIMDNISAGLASAAFIAFLSSLTNVSFTAIQYAIFSSLMTLFPKLFGGYSGTIVNSWGYDYFFLMTTIIGLPILVLIVKAERLMDPNKLKI